MDVAGPPVPGGLPPSAGLRSEPEVPVRPDLSERWGGRLRRFGDRHPRLARRAARAHALASWLGLVLLIAAVAGVPSIRPALVVGLGLLVLLGQLAALSRSRTVSFAGCARTLVLGALLAVPVALVEATVATSLRVPVDDPFAVVYLAGPIEELLKLTPLLLLIGVARHRVRRFAVVDFGLVAAAAGAGFQLAEDAVRRVTAPPNALVGPFETPAGLQYAWTHLLTGWVDWGLVRFPGHAVLTGLIGLGIGLAVRTRRRYGRVVWLLPLGCFLVAVLDHMGWADAVHKLLAGHVLAWPARLLHSLLGAGHATRWLFLVLLVAAVVLDFRAMRLVGDLLPPLPGAAPGRGLVSRAEAAAGHVRRTVPGDAAPVFHRLAGGVGTALVATADALGQAAHEGAICCLAARRGPMAFFSTLRLVRDRRELAQAIHHAAGRPRRDVPPRSEVERRCNLLGPTLFAEPGTRPAATAGAMAAALVAPGGALLVAALTGGEAARDGPAGPAFAATVADELAGWWHGLPPAGQLLAPLGALGLFAVLGGIWALPAGALDGDGTGTFLRDPGRATKRFLSNLTPGQVLYYAAARVLGLAVPEAVRRVLGDGHRTAGAAGSTSSRATFPPWQVQKRYPYCGPLFGLPATYTHQHGEQLRQALQEFVDAPDTVEVQAARYRGEAAVLHYHPGTRIAVVLRPGGEFRSCWRLTAAQYHDVVTLGSL